MPEYQILMTKRSAKELDRLSDEIALPIIDAIGDLATNPRPPGIKKLKGRDAYRIRVGMYRVIFEIVDKELVIHIITIGHRREVYR